MIYSIQRYCIHDGNGIRTTVFFKGCQLRCPWCANPESWRPHMQIGYLSHKCTDCGKCEQICPKHAIKNHRIDERLCDHCGKCAYYCPQDALQVYGKELSLEQLVEEVLRDRSFYEQSGGGVTFSGGEKPRFRRNISFPRQLFCIRRASIPHWSPMDYFPVSCVFNWYRSLISF